MEIYRLRAFKDNYIFLLYDGQQSKAAVIDPGDAEPVLGCLKQLKADLIAIFNTHHHHDHIGGNQELIKHFPDVCVYGGKEDQGRIPGQKVFLIDGDEVKFSDRTAKIFFVPGHTKAHIVYYFFPRNNNEVGELFCGDTIFGGGCGRLFEGTPNQMIESLGKLRLLPDSTRIWCAHEYTLNNLKFALTIDQNNFDLQRRFEDVKKQREEGEATVPLLLGIEKLTNVFLRWDDVEIKRAIGTKDDVQTFRKLRGMKELF